MKNNDRRGHSFFCEHRQRVDCAAHLNNWSSSSDCNCCLVHLAIELVMMKHRRHDGCSCYCWQPLSGNTPSAVVVLKKVRHISCHHEAAAALWDDYDPSWSEDETLTVICFVAEPQEAETEAMIKFEKVISQTLAQTREIQGKQIQFQISRACTRMNFAARTTERWPGVPKIYIFSTLATR